MSISATISFIFIASVGVLLIKVLKLDLFLHSKETVTLPRVNERSIPLQNCDIAFAFSAVEAPTGSLSPGPTPLNANILFFEILKMFSNGEE